MAFAFATCDTQRALGFLRRLYPSCADVETVAADLLGLIGKDIIRVCDPDFHGGQIIAGKNYNDADPDQVQEVCQRFHDAATQEQGA